MSLPARGCPPTAPLFLVWKHAHSVESYLSLYAKTLPLWGERLALDAGFSPPLPMQRRVSYRDHPVRYALFVPLLVHN